MHPGQSPEDDKEYLDGWGDAEAFVKERREEYKKMHKIALLTKDALDDFFQYVNAACEREVLSLEIFVDTDGVKLRPTGTVWTPPMGIVQERP